jgi:hypothetical protein
MTSALIEDELARKFVARGVASVATELPEAFHRRMHERLASAISQREESGVLARVPELHEVFDQPAVRAALAELLGPDYFLNPHSYGHVSQPGSGGHGWHKDSYVLDHTTRHPRPRWLMALYSPQELLPELGPTRFLPGWQYHEDLDELVDHAEAQALPAARGTVSLLHADMWHGAGPNLSGEARFVVKLLFERRREPAAAPEDAAVEWQRRDEDVLPLLSMDVWRWLRGQHGSAPPIELEDDEQLRLLLTMLDGPVEHARLQAAYALGRVGEPALPGLVEAVRREAIAAAESLGQRRPSDPKGYNRTALPAAQALSAAGQGAVAALQRLLDDAHWYVRATAADTLGDIGPAAAAAVAALARRGDDESWWVRRNAVEALGRIGHLDGEGGAALIRALRDPDDRVRLNAAVALAKMVAAPGHAVDELRRLEREEPDRFVRYYARLARRHGEGAPSTAGAAPVRDGWAALREVTA